MSNSQIDPIANNALKNLIENTPKFTAKDVMNSVAEEIAAQKSQFEGIFHLDKPEPRAESIKDMLCMAYYPRNGSKAGREYWEIDFNRTTSFCMEWRGFPYLVIQGPYTPICFSLGRAYEGNGVGDYAHDPIRFGLTDRVFIHMDPKDFPSEKQQQDLLMVAGKGDPKSGQ